MEVLSNESEMNKVAAGERSDWREHLKSRTGFRWMVMDFTVGLIACSMGYYLSPHNLALMSAHDFMLYVLPFALILSFCGKICDVPRPCQSSGMGRYDLMTSAGVALILSLLVFMVIMYAGSSKIWGRYILGYMALLSYLGIVAPRLLTASVVKARAIRVAIYGAGAMGHKFCDRIEGQGLFKERGNYSVLGFFDCDPTRRDEKFRGYKILGCLGDMDDAQLRALGVDVVVLCSENELSKENVSRLLNLPLQGVEVLTKAAFIEEYYQEVSVRYSNPHSFAAHRSLPGNAPIFAVKRAVDLAGGLVGLALTLPFWPLLALAIKLDSPGPVFFKQARVGFRGRVFGIYKFRTMRQDAEKDGAKWAVKGDSRITRLGKLLRVSRLDELPQLINVLKGEMSLVGPRPEVPAFVKELAEEIPFYERRHMVPPGLTGWAQIRYRYGASKDDALRKLQFDLYYIRHLSIGLDFQILLKTISMMMKGSR